MIESVDVSSWTGAGVTVATGDRCFWVNDVDPITSASIYLIAGTVGAGSNVSLYKLMDVPA